MDSTRDRKDLACFIEWVSQEGGSALKIRCLEEVQGGNGRPCLYKLHKTLERKLGGVGGCFAAVLRVNELSFVCPVVLAR